MAASSNGTTSSRSGTLSLKAGTKTASVSVSQAGKLGVITLIEGGANNQGSSSSVWSFTVSGTISIPLPEATTIKITGNILGRPSGSGSNSVNVFTVTWSGSLSAGQQSFGFLTNDGSGRLENYTNVTCPPSGITASDYLIENFVIELDLG